MLNRKGQNTAEYAILIALVVAAAVAMQVYVKRGVQGRVADAVDYAPGGAPVVGQNLTFNTKQYEPYYLQSSSDISSNRGYVENIAVRGGITRTSMNESTNRLTGATENVIWTNNFQAR